jgi:gliding motility-associated lipoprotein GldH
MKTKYFFIAILLLTLVSCTKQKTFLQFDTFPKDQRWEVSDAKTYEFEIEDDSKSYDIVFMFSHIFDYQFYEIPVTFEIDKPDGTIEFITKDIEIRTKDGNHKADCLGDICDLDYLIKEKTKLQKGNYKITITNSFNSPYLPNVIGVGLKVESVE